MGNSVNGIQSVPATICGEQMQPDMHMLACRCDAHNTTQLTLQQVPLIIIIMNYIYKEQGAGPFNSGAYNNIITRHSNQYLPLHYFLDCPLGFCPGADHSLHSH